MYKENIEAVYRTNRKSKRRMLNTIYAETERSLKIHAQQLCLVVLPDSRVYAEIQKEYEQCQAELSAYKKKLDLITRSGGKAKVQISQMKAIKFEPSVCGNLDNGNRNSNNNASTDCVLGYIVEYDINHLCGSVTASESTNNMNLPNSDKDTDGRTETKKGTTSSHNLESQMFGSLNSLLSSVAVPTRRKLKLEAVEPAAEHLDMSCTNSSQPSLLWQSSSSLDCKRSTSTESHSHAPSNSTFPEGVTFLRNGELVVADTTQGQLQIFDQTGATVKTITQDKLHQILGDWKFKPQCVATNLAVSNDIWVTDAQDKSIKLFNYDSGRCAANVPLLSYSMPYGLAILPNGHFVVSHCDDFLTIHDCQGHTLSTIQNDGNFWYVATDQYGRIITSDCYHHCVKIFDTRGTLLQRFGESGYGDGCLQYPHGVCVDPSGNIVVADSLNHRICQFNKHGKFVQTILQGGDFYWPRGIATDVRGHIAVTWQDHVSVWNRSSSSHFMSTYL